MTSGFLQLESTLCSHINNRITGSLVVISKSFCALTEGQKQKKNLRIPRLP
jgi:hypothetical protein